MINKFYVLSFPVFLCICLILVTGCKEDKASSIISDDPFTAELLADPAITQNQNTAKTQGKLDLSTAEVDSTQVTKVEMVSQPKLQEKKPTSRANIKRQPQIKFDLIRHDFGTIVQGDTVDYNFKFKNTGDAPLEIDSTKVTCGCTQPSYPFMAIEVGDEGYIGVKYVSVGKEGAQEPLITVYSNGSSKPTTLMLTGKVITAEQDSLILKKRVESSLDSIKKSKTKSDSLKN